VDSRPKYFKTYRYRDPRFGLKDEKETKVLNGVRKDPPLVYEGPPLVCQVDQSSTDRATSTVRSDMFMAYLCTEKTAELDSEADCSDCDEEATKVLHVKIFGRDGMAVRWQEALAEMTNPEPSDFRKLLSRVLREHVPFKAYFWECAPVSREILQNDGGFEFVLIDDPFLASLHADITPFEVHLRDVAGQPEMKVFQNPGRDSSLVAPAPATSDPEDYTHIAAFFIGSAPPSQQDAAWQALGHAISDELRTRDVVWVSTDGRGVHWLHFRVDSRPKYFKTYRYRDARFGLKF
jgi:hypothetical protein